MITENKFSRYLMYAIGEIVCFRYKDYVLEIENTITNLDNEIMVKGS